MTFDKPKFVMPDAAKIANINCWDINVKGLKIGTMIKTNTEIHLNIMFRDFVLKLSEKSQVMTIIQLEYSKVIFHVLDSVGKNDVDKCKGVIDERQERKVLRMERPLRLISEMRIIE